MARSLDELINFLLGEIAISGTRGTKVNEVLSLVHSFYEDEHHENGSAVARTPNIDRPFERHVWRWLTRHADVRVGDNREGNELTLDEVFPQHAPTDDAAQTKDHVHGGTANSGLSAATVQEKNTWKRRLKVFVSESRMWLAICGHLPDYSKVVPLEFVLLSIIASTREKGILQTDLVNASGQDKRSVPNRTDKLHARGYIEKRRIQVRGAVTSLLVLQKFAKTTESRVMKGKTGETSTGTGKPQETNFVDFVPLLQGFFDHLRKEKIITHKSLRMRLDMNSKWLRRIFSRMVCRLEESGCIKRIRAASKDSVNMKWFYPSIKFIREPTEDDLARYLGSGTNIDTVTEDASTMIDGNEDEQEDDEVEAVRAHQDESDGSTEALVEMERPCSQWNPDRLFNNTIVDIVGESSDEGASILHIRHSTFGQFFHRPVEHTLDKLVLDWFHTQPVHLRHLAVLRDVQMEGKTISYVHYTFAAFEKLVENSQTVWDAVLPKGDKRSAIIDRIIGQQSSVLRDEFGFPPIFAPFLQQNGGRSTLGQGIRASKPEKGRRRAKHTKFDAQDEAVLKPPFAPTPPQGTKRKSDGTRPPKEPVRSLPASSHQPSPAASHPERLERPAQIKPRGRPRKFMAGTEKYWQDMFAKVIIQMHPELKSTQRPSGKMSNPEALTFSQNRPPTFDKTLVQAMNLGFPLPVEPDDVNQSWVDKTLALLDHHTKGITVGPRIATNTHWGYSQLIIIRNCLLDQIGSSATATASTVRSKNTIASCTLPKTNSHAVNTNDARLTGVDPPQHLDRAFLTLHDDLSLKASLRDHSLVEDQSSQQTERALSPESMNAKLPARRGRSNKVSGGPLTRSAQARNPTLQPKHPVNNHVLPEPEESNSGVTTRSARASTRSLELDQPSQALRKRKRDTQTFSNQEGRTPKRHVAQDTSSAIRGRIEDQQLTPASSHEVTESQGRAFSHNECPTEGGADATESSHGYPTTEFELLDDLRDDQVDETPHDKLDASSTSLHPEANENLQLRRDDQFDKPKDASTRSKRSGFMRGTIAFKRKQIVLDIIKTCHGVMPFDISMWYAFFTKWRRTGEKTRPDTRTVKATVKALVEDGKLKKLGFGFKDKKDVMRTGHMIAGLEISPTSTEARSLMQKMVEKYPEAYYPAELDYDLGINKSESQPRNRVQGFAEIDRTAHTISDSIPAVVQKKMKHSTPSDLHPHAASLAEETSGTRESQKSDASRLTKHGSSSQSIFTLNRRLVRPGPLRLKDKTKRTLESIFPKDSTPPIENNRKTVPTHSRNLPSSLDDILHEDRRKIKVDYHSTEDISQAMFYWNLDSVRRWELRKSGLFIFKSNEWQFINHLVEGSALQNSTLKPFSEPVPFRFEALTRFDEDGQEYFDVSPYEYDTPEARLPNNFTFLETRPLEFGTIPSPASSKKRKAYNVEEHRSPKRLKYTGQPAEDIESENETRKGLKRTLRRRQYSRSRAEGDGSGQESSTQAIRSSNPIDSLIRKRKRGLTSTWTDTRRKKQRLEDRGNRRSTKGPIADNEKSAARGPQISRMIPPDQIYHIGITIIVVRTLAGGVERAIDWSIVMPCLPDYEAQFIKDRWRTISSKYSQEILRLSDAFSERYLEAYTKGEVPPLDFSNLVDNDWDGMIDWAKKELRRPYHLQHPDLPSTREILEVEHNIDVEPPVTDIRDHLNHNSTATIPTREAALASIPFATPVYHGKTPSAPSDPVPSHAESPSATTISTSELDTAKSWTRALILTPGTALSLPTAKAKFDLLPEAAHRLAKETLVTDRVIIRIPQKSQQPASSMTYTLSNNSLRALGSRRPITPSMLKEASRFKVEVMDVAFRAGKPVTYRPGWTTDGQMVALLECVGRGRVRAVPVNPPRNRYGLIDSYQTRQIDKAKLRFQVDFLPVDGEYVSGRPLVSGRDDLREEPDTPILSVYPPPRLGADDPTGRIPLWLDIHGNLIPRMWDLIVAGTLGILATRPGASAAEVAAMLGPAVDDFDVEGVLGWCEGTGAVRRTNGGHWEVEEWWWMALEGAEEEEGFEGELPGATGENDEEGDAGGGELQGQGEKGDEGAV